MSSDPNQASSNFTDSGPASAQSPEEPQLAAPGPASTQTFTAPPLPTPSREWFVAIAGTQYGPLTLQEVLSQINHGQMTLADPCWKNGMANWTPSGSVVEISQFVHQGGQTIISRQAIEGGVEQAKRAAEVGKVAAKDAFAAFLKFIVDPVGGLPSAYESLGNKASLSAGIVFCIAFVIFCLLGVKIVEQFVQSGLLSMIGGVWVRVILTVFMPCICLPFSLLVIRSLGSSVKDFHADIFIAGSALLPLGMFILLSALLAQFWQVVAVSAIFAWSYLLLILFTGLTRIYRISEARTAILLPLVLTVTMGITGMVAYLLFSGLVPRF